MSDGPNDPDIAPEVREAFERLLDTYAVDAEHRLVTRLELLRETLQHMLTDPAYQDERYQDWLRRALQVIDERKRE